MIIWDNDNPTPFKDMINQVICGDCLDVMKHIPDKSVDLVLTDPPYNISYGNDIKRDWRPSNIKKNFGDWDKDYNAENMCLRSERVSKHGVFTFSSSEVFGDYIKFLKGYDYQKYIIWDKTNPSPSIRKSTWRQSTELMIHAHNKNKINFIDQKSMRNIYKGNTCAHESLEHPTQKPIDLMIWIVDRTTLKDWIILDPFLGSGTTAVACKQLGRNFIGIEKEKKYCDIAERRMAQDYLF